MVKILTTIIVLIFLSGCASTNGNYAEFSEKPFLENPATSELLFALPDLDQPKIKTDNPNFFKAILTVIIADVSMSLDNVLGVAGAAKDHYFLLVFGLILSIILMATVANVISKWIKKYKWIGWLGLLAILVVALELIYSDISLFL